MLLATKYYLIAALLFSPNWIFSQTIATYAGGGSSVLDGVPAVNERIGLPGFGSFDRNGNYYFGANRSGPSIRRIDTNGIIHTVAGNGTAGYSGDGGPATLAQLRNAAMVSDSDGNIFIADWYNARVRRVDATTGIISTIAGNGTPTSTGDGGPASIATVVPLTICLDSKGNIFILDSMSKIRKIDTYGIISTVAGNGSPGFSGDGGPATSAAISVNFGICADKNGNLYMGCPGRIRKVDGNTGLISTIAGSGAVVYNGDGISADSANFQPYVLVLDVFGNFFIGDWNQRIREIDTFKIIHTIAGNGMAGFSGDGGPADSAEIFNPEGLAFDGCGNMYIADDNNGRIRKVTMPGRTHITLSAPATAIISDTVTVTASLIYSGYSYTIKWYNKGALFATTSVPYVQYVKTMNVDSITAVVYGCSDSVVSAVHVVTKANEGVSTLNGSNGIELRPNPAQSVLYISAPFPIQSLSITNLVGQSVYDTHPPANTTQAAIAVKNWQPGVYFVRVVGADGGVAVQRFVKE